MSAFVAAIVLALQAATPAIETDEKMALATEIASTSLLATIGPLQTAAEVEEIVAQHPELTPEEQASLRAVGAERAEEIGRAALETEARTLAENLSLETLRVVAAYQRSEAAQAYRAATPMVMGAVMQSLAGLDFKGEVKAAFCAESGKLCETSDGPD
tara:strand:- start:2428 stop:2901 length:474 start_codon:yes stop_codon:yes gene_type:complete